MSDRKEEKRLYYLKNKKRINERNKKWKQKNKETYLIQQQQYNNSNKRKQPNTIKDWKYKGLKLYGYTYEEVYEYYLSVNNCEVCNKSISGYNKHMDHCHITGCFRWVLCNSCNTKDNWINKLKKNSKF